MVKVLIYGDATGVFTLRKIARKLHEDVTFSLLSAALSQASRDRRFSRQSFAGTRGVVPGIERRADRLAAIQAVRATGSAPAGSGSGSWSQSGRRADSAGRVGNLRPIIVAAELNHNAADSDRQPALL
ncbi:hypothetical protein [Methylococcus sp. BF19-07]|uniref:hypothetical protein n=1 Tax=Methylococcus sp. BF19-07 TaxID=2743472 RepID=UPI00351B778B